MSKRDNLMDYIFTTPGNMNPVILNQKIDETVNEEGGGETPTGTITITENDTYDVTNYASANVNVSGGSSDFTTATVTFINDPTRLAYDVMALPHIVNEKLITDNITVTTQTDVVIPLYKGYAYSSLLALRDTDTQSDPTTTGDITIDWESADLDIIISGNGTFTAKGLPAS